MLRLSGPVHARWNPLAPARRQGWHPSLLAAEVRAVSRNPFLGLAFTTNLVMVAGLLYLLTVAAGRLDPASALAMIALLAATPTMNYASFCFAKDGLYYPGFMTRMTTREYVEGKVRFMRLYTVACNAAILPFLAFGNRDALVPFLLFVVYNVGCGGMVMLYLSSFDRNKIRLSAPPIFNTQGISLWKTLFVMPVVTPMFFFENARELSLWITLFLGLAGLPMAPWATALIARNVARRKHRYLAL